MNPSSAWISDDNAAMLTDLYELTMIQAYYHEDLHGEAVFDLFSRRLPSSRNYLIACGLDDALRYLELIRFTNESIAYLESTGKFTTNFLKWLKDLRFTGDVYAVPEGTPVFANEPIVQVVAPIAEAQLAETFLINQVQLQTMLASKASRIVHAASGRTVVDFGLRRAQGTDAGMKAARAFYVAGVDATSNVLAGQVYDIPIAGTMAHSYIEAHDDEYEAFRAFAEFYPETTLLVDTYDTLEGVRKVIELAREMGENFAVKAVRLDSGDLDELSKQTRRLLDEAGLESVGIFVSGGLDERIMAGLLADGAPINGFGIGSAMAVSQDAPALDSAYKLASYAGEGRMKLSPHKSTLPGRKQVYRMNEGTEEAHDVIGRVDEAVDGRPLLVPVMRGGQRLDAWRVELHEAREHCRRQVEMLPSSLRRLEPADPPYRVEVSAGLREDAERLKQRLTHERANT
jgi:nicotinate phosphoribosyltransferase